MRVFTMTRPDDQPDIFVDLFELDEGHDDVLDLIDDAMLDKLEEYDADDYDGDDFDLDD